MTKINRYTPLSVRFWSRVNKDGPIHPIHGRCWLWTGCKHHSGYGLLKIKGIMTGAHKASYEINIREVPTGLNVLHKCDNKLCVNPKHLFVGTEKDNMDDKVSKGRQTKGTEVNTAVLDETTVRLIRKIYIPGDRKFGANALARRFNVSRFTTYAIVNWLSWKHLK